MGKKNKIVSKKKKKKKKIKKKKRKWTEKLKATKFQKFAFKKKKNFLTNRLKCYHGADQLKILEDVAKTMRTACPLFLKSNGLIIYNLMFSRINTYSVGVAKVFDSVRKDVEGKIKAGHLNSDATLLDLWVTKLTVFAQQAKKKKGLEHMTAAKKLFYRLKSLHKSGKFRIERRTVGNLFSAARHLNDRPFAEELLKISLRLGIRLWAEDVAVLIHLTREVHNNLKLLESHCVDPPGADLINEVSEILRPTHDIFTNCCPALDGSFDDKRIPWTLASIPRFKLSRKDTKRIMEKLVKDSVGTKKANPKHWRSFQKFKNVLERDGGAEAVIDGANIMHYGQRQGVVSYAQLDKIISTLEEEGLKTRVVLSRWRTEVRDAGAALYIKQWKKRGQLYISPCGFDDDFCWLYCALYSSKFFKKTFMVTNDLLKDYTWDLHEFPFFFHWIHSTVVRLRTVKDQDITLTRDEIKRMREERVMDLENASMEIVEIARPHYYKETPAHNPNFFSNDQFKVQTDQGIAIVESWGPGTQCQTSAFFTDQRENVMPSQEEKVKELEFLWKSKANRVNTENCARPIPVALRETVKRTTHQQLPWRTPSSDNLPEINQNSAQKLEKYNSADLTILQSSAQYLMLYWPFQYALKVHKLANAWYLPSIRRRVDGTVDCSGWPYVEHEDEVAKLKIVFNSMLPTKSPRVPFIPPLPYQIADRIVWTLFVPKNSTN